MEIKNAPHHAASPYSAVPRMRSSSDITEIVQLVLRERQGRDRQWWAQMADCFASDSWVRVSWFAGTGAEFVAASQGRGGRKAHPVHRLATPVVQVEGDRAVVEVAATIDFRGEIEGVETDQVTFGRLLYRVERHEDTWLIVDLTCVYERDTLAAVVPDTKIPLDRSLLATFRPSYRFLAYQFSVLGVTVADDLPGDDRPEELAALYAQSRTWLEQR